MIQGRKVDGRKVDAGTDKLILDISGDQYFNGVFMIVVDKAGDRRYEKLVINR